jgi:hypothetical protein
MSSKKRIESAYLESFKALFTNFPLGQIEPTEEPDFLVHEVGSVLGIELTELHRKSPEDELPQQAGQAMRQRVVNRAREIFERSGHPQIHASVLLRDTPHISKAQVEPLALTISNLVAQNLPDYDSSPIELPGWEIESPFPDFIHQIKVYRIAGLTRSFFSCPGSTWIATLAPEDIERVLALKEPKYTSYRNRCSRAWLLINADISSMSTWFEFESDALARHYCSSFDRVFLLRHFGQKLYELHIAASDASFQ